MTVMTAETHRSELGATFEDLVAVCLGCLGWRVDRYTIGGFWRPDFIATRDDRMRLIDAKMMHPRSFAKPNYTIETRSLDELATRADYTRIPVFVVFYDWTVADVYDLRRWSVDGDLTPGHPLPPGSIGTGDPYWLIPRRLVLQRFDEVFA